MKCCPDGLSPRQCLDCDRTMSCEIWFKESGLCETCWFKHLLMEDFLWLLDREDKPTEE